MPHSAHTDLRREPTYSRYRQLAPLGIRGVARAGVLSALATAARLTGRLERELQRPRLQFLYLHHVFTDEEQGFRRLLAWLARHHSFIGHTEAWDRLRAERIDKPYVSVSFDDGFEDNCRAASILEEFGATGCFFVCPSIVGERDPARLAAFCASRLRFPLVSRFLDWPDIENLLARGHEIGSHTMTHPDVGEIPAGQIQDEVAQSRQELLARLGSAKHFAWPLGQWKNFPPVARDAVFGAGYDSCSSAVRGCHVEGATGPDSSICIRRDHVLANWPLEHVGVLMMRNSARATVRDNRWPVEYSVAS